MNLFAKKSWFGLSKDKRTRKKQLWEESQKEEHPLPSVAGPVLLTGGWGLTTAPCPWLVEDLSSYTYSCPGGSSAGSSIEGASSAAACSFLHIISCSLDACLHPLWAWFQKLVQSRSTHALLEPVGRWDVTDTSPDNEHFIFTIFQFLRLKLSNFYLPFSFCDFTVFINISDFGC